MAAHRRRPPAANRRELRYLRTRRGARSADEALLGELADPDPHSKPYEQARVFGRLIIEDIALACDLRQEHSFAFMWGAGRAGDKRSAPLVLETLREPLGRLMAQRTPDPDPEAYFAARGDDDLIGFCVWALGKMGARDSLADIIATLGGWVTGPRSEA